MVVIKKISGLDTLKIRQTVMYPNSDISEVMLENDHEGLHFGLFVNSELVTVISLFIKSDTAQFRKFATLDSYQSNGYGTKMMHHLIEYCRTHNVSTLWCNARSSKTRFYSKFGLNPVASPYKVNNIEYVKLQTSLL